MHDRDAEGSAGSGDDGLRDWRAPLAKSATLEETARLGVNVTTLWRERKRYGLG